MFGQDSGLSEAEWREGARRQYKLMSKADLIEVIMDLHDQLEREKKLKYRQNSRIGGVFG